MIHRVRYLRLVIGAAATVTARRLDVPGRGIAPCWRIAVRLTPMSGTAGVPRPVDVVILTAISLEYLAVLEVEEGAYPGSQWDRQVGPNNLPLSFRTFQGRGGRPLHVAVGQAGDMGVMAAANALLPLVLQYRPKCIAMAGVCAGRPGKTSLGDVIIAERLFFHDTGKQLPHDVQQDLKTYNLREDWKIALEHFDFSGQFQAAPWWQKRPIPLEWQENWILHKLGEGIANPFSHPDCSDHCPQWEKAVAALWQSGDVVDGDLVLTEKGQNRIQRMLIKHKNCFPDISPGGDLLPFRTHVAAMGSGNKVIEDDTVWSFISEHIRKTLGLEMEAVALGAIAHAQRTHRLDALVMKGVMDFGNAGRDDHFKEFAARAATECLIAFLRQHIEVEAQVATGHPAGDVTPNRTNTPDPMSEKLGNVGANSRSTDAAAEHVRIRHLHPQIFGEHTDVLDNETLLRSVLPKILRHLVIDPTPILLRVGLPVEICRGEDALARWSYVCGWLVSLRLRGSIYALHIIDEVQEEHFSVELSTWAATYIKSLRGGFPGSDGGEFLGSILDYACREQQRWAELIGEIKRRPHIVQAMTFLLSFETLWGGFASALKQAIKSALDDPRSLNAWSEEVMQLELPSVQAREG